MERASELRWRRETAERLFQKDAEIRRTTPLFRAPRLAAASLRGGALALVVKLRGLRPTGRDLGAVHSIVASLGELKGAAMKLGQHLGYVDSTIPPEVRAALSALHTHSAPMPSGQVHELIERELGPEAAPILRTIEPRPVAAASIGQVHRARLPDGTHVAVKVQYPGIAEAIEADFGPLSSAGRLAARLWPGWAIDGFVHEARARLIEECDYAAEARHQIDMAARFAGHPTLVIPEVHTLWSSTRVLTTTWVDGLELDELIARGPSQGERDRLGAALRDFYVGSLTRWGLVNGDPHPGNYLFGADGKVAIVDLGSARDYGGDEMRRARLRNVLDAPDRASAVRAAVALDGDALLLLRVRFGLAAVLERLGARDTGWREPAVEAEVAASAEAFAADELDDHTDSVIGLPPQAAPVDRLAAVARGGEAELELDEAWEVEAAAPMPPPIAPTPAPAPVRAAPPPIAHAVVLLDPGPRVIEIVREIRDLTGGSIAEAMERVNRPPYVVDTFADPAAARALHRRLDACGATVEIRPTTLAAV